MTLHIGLLGFLTTAMYIIIFGFVVHTLCSRYPDSAIAKAFGYIY